MDMLKCRMLPLVAFVLFAQSAAVAGIEFTLSPAQPVVVQPGGSFSLAAEVFNTNAAGGESYVVDSYSLFVTPSDLVLPDDLSDDPTNFLTNFQRTFAPGDLVSAPFVDFTVGDGAALGNYSVQFELQDPSGSPIAQQSFALQIQHPSAVPEPEFFQMGALLALGSLCYVRRRWRVRDL